MHTNPFHDPDNPSIMNIRVHSWLKFLSGLFLSLEIKNPVIATTLGASRIAISRSSSSTPGSSSAKPPAVDREWPDHATDDAKARRQRHFVKSRNAVEESARNSLIQFSVSLLSHRRL